jgi:hypothetical protein
MNAELVRTTSGYKINIYAENEPPLVSINFDFADSEIEDPWLEARVCLDCIFDASNFNSVLDFTGEAARRGQTKHSRIDV